MSEEAEVTQPTDDDARLAEIRLLLTERPGRKLPPDTNKMRFLLRLLDEARAERDALAAKLTKAISLIKDVRDNGLIYWEPNTSRGAANRALMFRSIDETIAALDDTGGRDEAEAVAIALDAARRQALEQALQWVEAIHEGKDNSRDPAVVHNTCSRIEHAIRALIDREPTP